MRRVWCDFPRVMIDLNDTNSGGRSQTAFWVPLTLVVLAIALRVVKSLPWGADVLPNFSPWMALMFANTLLFPGVLRWYAVLVMLLVVDGVMQSGWWLDAPGTALAVYGMFALVAWCGWRLREKRSRVLWVMGGTVVASVLFYVVSNTVSWLGSPAYPGGMVGWLQALTVGLPGFPPSWVFFRNALISDVGFAGMLVLGSQLELRSRVALGRLAAV
jgi:hypothetical protein